MLIHHLSTYPQIVPHLIDIHQCLSVTKNFDGITLSHLEELAEDKKIKAISDDGVGVPNDFNILETKTLGLKLIYTLVKQLDGIFISFHQDIDLSQTFLTP